MRGWKNIRNLPKTYQLARLRTEVWTQHVCLGALPPGYRTNHCLTLAETLL